MKDYGSKISDTDKKNIREKISQLKKDLETKDKEKIKKSMDELSTASHKLAEVLYQEAQKKQQSQQQQQQAKAQGKKEEKPKGTGKEGAVDAEYKEVDEDKKEEK